MQRQCRHVGVTAHVEPVVLLAEHAHAQVFEHRQAVGQHHRVAQAIELETQRTVRCAERAVQRERQGRGG